MKTEYRPSGIIYQTESGWKWTHQEDNQTILISVRTGNRPHLNSMFFEKLLEKQLEELGSIGSTGGDHGIGLFETLYGNSFFHRVRGVFLDNKNGNVGTLCTDIFFTTNCDECKRKIKQELEELQEIHCEDGPGYELILYQKFFFKGTSNSDNWFPDNDTEFKETKEEIFWGKL